MTFQFSSIQDLAADRKSALATGPFGSSIGSKTFQNDGLPVIRGSNLSEAVGIRLKDDGLVFIDPELAEKFTRSKAVRGDLVFTCWGTVNQVGLIDERSKHEEYIVSNKQMKFSPDPEKASALFLYYYFSSPLGQRAIADNTIGSSVPGFNLTALKGIQVPAPSLSIQNSIANFLGTFDDKIELNRRMNETLEEMARALFRDWFVDFGPTRRQMALNEKGLAPDPAAIMGQAFPLEKATTFAPLFPAKLGDDGLPEGWETRELRSALTLNYGKSLPKKTRTPGPFNVYGSGGISGTHDTALVKGPSIIVGRKGTVGSLHWSVDDFFPIDTVFYVTSQHPMVFCHRLLETLGLETMNTDAAVPGLNRDNAYRQEFAYGSDKLVEAFAEFGDPLVDKADANEKENQTLAALRDLLLPRLMSGEIRLKDAEV